ncbi:P-loop NTPase fold protein [Mycobacterium sp. 29Ha]|uniref:KAP family P-loop NTPase fold protein n=1 Tax=Mycobacterium sp. 29Ha TaxID=2939268 RepID=UPI002938DB7D|nr:P-loop NTPase fold protein [Mycobacterium sp. 29Ha]MDV3135738.1 KAP family NTPase [Mycobacterium sp. 29Ha]
MADTLRLWDDNPTEIDMLGFGPVVASVVAAVSSADLDPVTVALQSSWGGGKSSALKLLKIELDKQPDLVVVPCDPWEYDDLPKAEVRSLLIGQVLKALETKPGFLESAKGLMRRIAWVKVGATITNMALAREVDAEKLVDAFTPVSKEPTSMAGFRDEFAAVMEGAKDVRKVVVLIDDLDRCSPDSVVAILEAIKVFLSVPKMAFVLAAEETLIRYAVERSANAGARSTYSDRYLEKIVQLPVRLPTLSREDAETFILLLLSHRRGASPEQTDKLIAHVRQRRENSEKPYVGGAYAEGVQIPEAEDLTLAAQIAQGISVDKWSSPRAIKRFLNAWGVRMTIATARGSELDLGVMLKLYILEDRYPKSFSILVETSPEARGKLLDEWEAWATAAPDSGETKLPEGLEDDTRDWAAAAPKLASIAGKIDAYLNVAATFTSASAGEGLSTDALRLMDDLLDDSEPIRRAALKESTQLDLEERAGIVLRLLERAAAANPDIAIESACGVAKSADSLAPALHDAVLTHAIRHLTPASIVDIAQIPGAANTLQTIVDDNRLESDVRQVATDELLALTKDAR